MRRPTPRTWRCGAGLRALCAIAASLGWAVALPAAAQSTLTGGRGTLLVPDADTVPPTHFTTSFGAGYTDAARDRFQPAPVGVTFGFWNDLDVGLGLRSWSQGDPEARGASVDPQLALKLRLVREAPGRPALALALGIDHPFQGLDFSPSLIVHKNRGPLLLTGELGWRLPLRGGPVDAAAPFAGVGAGYWLSASTSFFAQALGEGGREARLWLMPGVAFSLLGPDPFEKRRESLRVKAREALAALETELGTRVDAVPDRPEATAPTAAPALAGRVAHLSAPGRVTLFVTGGPAVGAGPAWRVFAGIQISSFDEFLQDSDGDGIPDRVDRCPFDPEDWDGYEDGDGCPDHGTEVLRKLALDRLAAAAAQGPKLTTPLPRFRLRIPVGEVPDRERRPRDVAPMYQPLEVPPASSSPAPPPPAPVPAPEGAAPAGPRPAAGPGEKVTRHDRAAPRAGTGFARPELLSPPPIVLVAPTAPTARAAVAPPSLAPAPAALTARPPSRPSVPGSPPRGTPPRPAAVHRDGPVSVAVLVLPPSRVVHRSAPLVQIPLRRAAGSTRPSVAMERALTGAAFAQFTSSAQPLLDRDREAIESAVRTAGAEGGELLVWAQAREAALLPEAARRAEEIAALAGRLGALATTRVTTSPGTSGEVDVQVTATVDRVRLRYEGAGEPSDVEKAVGGDGDGDPAPLESSDAGRRQLREAAAAHRGALQKCLAFGADGRQGDACEAVVRIAVDADGSATAALRRDAPVWQPAVDACLAAEARGWRFPVADGGYVFDVPLDVLSEGSAP